MKKESKKIVKKKDTVLDSVLDKIEKEEIHPIPKWKFVLKNIVSGVVISAGLIFGIIGLTMSFIYWSRIDADVLHINSNIFEILSYTLPVFWIVVIGISLSLAYFTFISSEKGYKYSVGLILILFGLIVIGSSTFSYFADARLGFSRNFENIVGRDIADPRFRMWNRPEDGFIAGEVKSKVDENLYIIDFVGRDWIVDTSNTMYSMRFDINEGTKIKVRGELVGDKTIKAIEIRPWERPGRGCMQENGCGPRSTR